MAINMPTAQQGSPFERLLGAVQGVQGVTQTFKDSARKDKDREELESPDSPLMLSIRQYGAAKGIQVPENLNYLQFEKTPLKVAIDARIKGDEEIRQQSAKTKADKALGQRLPADKVLLVNEGKQIPRLLGDIGGTIEANKDIFGPVMGNLSALNPYSERAQTIDGQVRTAAQSFGRYMEGGVLRKEDEIKYRKMFPALGDTPEVARNKLALIDRQLKQKLTADVQALKASGYDTKGLGGEMGEAPGLPEVLAGPGKRGGGPPTATAASPQDSEALQWAKSNSGDPRAAAIMAKLKAKGLQ